MGVPKAIIVVSAHWAEAQVTVTNGEHLPLIYDFYGFPKPYYELEYAAETARELADEVVELLANAGIPARTDAQRGLDHGAWIPLRLMFPEANVPVIQMSLIHNKPDVFHLRLGRALSTLRQQGVLILGSGSVTHNLGDCAIHEPETELKAVPEYVSEFTAWIAENVSRREDNALLNWRQNAPSAERAHPTDEHFVPFFVALGAAGLSWEAERIHQGFMYKALAMDAYLFNAASKEAQSVNH